MSQKTDLLAEVIRQRKTEKILCSPSYQQAMPEEVNQKNQQYILDALETAGWAPFHYPRDVDGIAEPWRAHVLWHAQAQNIAAYLSDQLGVTSKEPMLAAACHALVLVTWLPEDEQQSMKVERTIARNHEHLAAASAMVQNFLLMLTANEMGNYWSSGGQFGSEAVFEHLGIPRSEKLLAAVFIEFAELRDLNDAHKTRKAGAQRDNRCVDWIKQIASIR